MGMSSDTRVEVGERGVLMRGEERAGRALAARRRAPAGEESKAVGGGAILDRLTLTVPELYVSDLIKDMNKANKKS